MNIYEYMMHLARFHKINFPDAPEDNFAAIVKKLKEECREVDDAHITFGRSRELMQEFADCINVAMWGIIQCGGKNPLWEAFLKLEKTTEKYQALRERGKCLPLLKKCKPKRARKIKEKICE